MNNDIFNIVMKSFFKALLAILVVVVISGFGFNDDSTFDIDYLYDYQRAFESEDIDVCAVNTTKTYMDYRATSDRSSRQYQFIRDELTVDEKTGFLYDEDGFIAVALGSFYGEIGNRYYFTLDSGVVLPLVKAEEKADKDTDSTGCFHTSDGSVIEFVIDKNFANNYFGNYGNGLVLQGNYNNHSLFRGQIVRVEKVLSTKKDDYVTYAADTNLYFDGIDIFSYGRGY